MTASADGVAVRPLAATDRAAWGGLWQGYLDFYETTLPAAQFDLHFSQMIDPEVPETTGFVAIMGDRLAGLAHCIWHVHGWYAAPVCYLQDLYTDPALRGRGAGTALVRAVYAEADARGAPRVYWTTQAFNHDARRLYDRVGVLTPFIKYQRP